MTLDSDLSIASGKKKVKTARVDFLFKLSHQDAGP